jgi:hypothetical protein
MTWGKYKHFPNIRFPGAHCWIITTATTPLASVSDYLDKRSDSFLPAHFFFASRSGPRTERQKAKTHKLEPIEHRRIVDAIAAMTQRAPRERMFRTAAHLMPEQSSVRGGGGGINTEQCSATAQPPRALPGPLSGIRVLDMSAVISGPWAASVLADQGADVIKIEAPNGPDLTRSLGPGPPGLGSMYVTANRGKRSITLDLQKEEGVRVFKQLVAQSDVVVQNYRPGVAERLGVDYDSLCAVRSALVMVSISGWGDSGPYVKARVFDQVIQTMTGVGAIMQDSEGGPTMFHNLLMDKVTG